MWQLLAACGSEKVPPPPPSGCGIEGGVVELETSDGLTLAADYLPAPTCGAPALVLLHMIPPTWDRSSWPQDFRARLVDAGLTVLVLDRRGAGASEGDPQDAYEGPDGWRDVEAAARRLRADGWGDLSILGASNGTTSLLDYTVRAPAQDLPEPVSVGFMTGGAYTENQHPMSALPPIPAIFTYSTEERAWSEAQRALDPGGWIFHEYPEGDHGTRMFDAAPQVSDDLLAFFAPGTRRRR